jgi:hypothetical protein
MSRANRTLALLLACAACAHGTSAPREGAPDGAGTPRPPGATAAPPADASAEASRAADAARLAAIRADVDRLLTAQAKALWEAWTRGVDPDLGAGLVGLATLRARETLEFVKARRDHATGDERRALTLLHAYLVGEHLAQEASTVASGAPPPVSWNGTAVATWRVPGLLAEEPDGARRARLEHAWAEAERHGDGEGARWQAIAAAAQRLGYDSLLALAAELRGAPVEALAALAEGVFDATDAGYRAILDELAKVEMGKGLAQLRGRDLPRLFRAGEDPRAFPAARVAQDVRETLRAIGLDPAGLPGAVLDLERRPGKDPRALALPVEVPGGVRVSFTASGGVSDVRSLLHELGAATYYAHVATPVLEFRRLGTVTAAAWAALFEDLAGDPTWLAERTGLAETHVAPLVRAAAVRRLHQARVLAARILVEIARAQRPGKATDVAKPILERAFARAVDADELDLFLLERDPTLEAADRLQAILLAAHAAAFLGDRDPPAWWRSKANGAFLVAAFAEGSRPTPAELARSLGGASLDPRVLDAVTRERCARAGLRPFTAADGAVAR